MRWIRVTMRGGPIPLCAVALVLTSCGSQEPTRQASRSGTGLAVGQVGIEAVWERPLTPGEQSRGFRVAVHVPPSHHAYLDKGDDGFLIPLTFSFAAAEATGARVTSTSRPRGGRDEQFHATVLRGTADFGFRLEPGTGGLEGSLRYQICNDLTSVCYPPRDARISLPAQAP